MGASWTWGLRLRQPSSKNIAMAPKAMKAAAKAMSKGGLADVLATSAELKKGVVSKILDKLAEVGTAEVKKGVFTIPGLVRIKTKKKPATKAAKRMMFGQEVVVKAK